MTRKTVTGQDRASERAKAAWPGWLWRGFLMGLADMVPGVSGGTMAFITGIYPRFIAALAGFDLALVRAVLRGHWRLAWQKVDAAFLLTLGFGILSAIVAMSHLVHLMLTRLPWVLWGVFLGLLLGAAFDLARQVPWRWSTASGALAGLVLALLTLVGPAMVLTPGPLIFFVGGAVAITAMLLPGISGSLLLLMMGLYLPVLDAVRGLDPGVLLAVAGGCATGILVFSRLINWLLMHHFSLAIASMTGILVGALPRLWPWQAMDALDSGGWAPVWPADLPLALLGLVAVLIGGGIYGIVARYR